MGDILKIAGLEKHFGGLYAIRDLSLEVREGEIRGLIGPNGSGKTTLFNLISGVYRADKGTIVFDGTDITRWEPHDIARRGVARSFQLLRIG